MKGDTIEREEYVSRVLSLYLGLAEELYEKQIRLEEVESAMILASARRLLRSADAPKLGPIRSLHYFLPVSDEVRSVPVSADYIQYLRGRLAAFDEGRLKAYSRPLR